MKVNIKKFTNSAVIPVYGTDLSAGADLFADIDHSVVIQPNETVLIGTGIGMEIPKGFVGLICARSGLSVKKGLAPANKVGVVDADYRGEIKVAVHNHGQIAQTIEPRDRIAQFIITSFIHADYELVDELDDTERGSGGFGSTGQ